MEHAVASNESIGGAKETSEYQCKGRVYQELEVEATTPPSPGFRLPRSRALPAGRGGLDRVVVRRPEVDRRPSVDRLDDRDLTDVIGLMEHVP